jgi:hypothetical protein
MILLIYLVIPHKSARDPSLRGGVTTPLAVILSAAKDL